MRNTELGPNRLRAAKVAITATTAGVLVLVAGCSSSFKSSTASMPTASSSAAASAAGDAQFTEPRPGEPAANSAPAGGAVAAPAASASAAPTSGAQTSAPVPQSLLTARQVIYTADITVRTKDIKKTVADVQSLTTRNGGFIFAEQVNLMPKDPNSSGLASATVTIHVPPTSLASVLAQISALGIELDRNQHAEDVTAQVVDVDARATAAQNSLKRLNELFAHAGTVAELTSLEQQIAQREAERDSLLSQQKTLAAQVAAATITVNLVGTPAVAAAVPQPKKAHVFGFLKGLRGGWHALTKTASGLATALGAMLPFLVILALLAPIALVVRRRVVRAGRGHEPPAQPDPIG
jgi:Domain of unknown function (DUF4349)